MAYRSTSPSLQPSEGWSPRQNWTKLEEIDPNWSKLGLMRVTVSYRCLLQEDEARAVTCKVVGEVRGVVGGAGAHHHPLLPHSKPPPWHQITPRYSPQSLRKLQWLAPRKISQIGRYVRGNGPRTEAGHLPHGFNQSESSRPKIPQWESLLVAAVAEPGGLGGCVGLRRDQGNIG